MKLRFYQQNAVDDTKLAIIKKWTKIIVMMCTGAGKSPYGRKICELAYKKGTQVLYITPSDILTTQMRGTLHGLDNVIVECLQTSINREYDDIKIIIIDEFHWAVNSKLQDGVLAKYPDAIVIGLSATPITHQGYKIDGWDGVVSEVQLCDLVEWGFASRLRVMCPQKLDTSKFKKSGIDFNSKDVAKEVTKSSIVNGVVDKYVKYGENRKAVFYAITIEHAELLKSELLEKNYIAEVYHSKISKKGRGEIMELFKTDYIHLLINVSTLVTGFDYPRVYCIVLASPTRSIIKAVQAYGRLTRLDDSLDKVIYKVKSKKVVFIPRHDYDYDKIKEQLKEKGLYHIVVQSEPIEGYEIHTNVFPNNPDKVGLLLDCANVIENTVHPMERLVFNKVKKDDKKCDCGGKIKVLYKRNEVIDEMFYKLTTATQCVKCLKKEIVEEEKAINFNFCEKCESEIIQGENKTFTIEDEKSISVVSVCPHCKNRQIIKSVEKIEAELEELVYKVTVKKNMTWDEIRLQLKKATNKDGKKYHHNWSRMVVKDLQENNIPLEKVVDMVQYYVAKGWTLGNIGNKLLNRSFER